MVGWTQGWKRLDNRRDPVRIFYCTCEWRLMVGERGERLSCPAFPLLHLAGLLRLFLICVWRVVYCCSHIQLNWEKLVFYWEDRKGMWREVAKEKPAEDEKNLRELKTWMDEQWWYGSWSWIVTWGRDVMVFGISCCFFGYRVMLSCTMTVTYWAIFVHSYFITLPFYCVPFLFRTAAGQNKKKVFKGIY